MRQVIPSNMGQLTPPPAADAPFQVDHQINWNTGELVTHFKVGEHHYLITNGECMVLAGEEYVPAQCPPGLRIKHDLMRLFIKGLVPAMTLGFFCFAVFMFGPMVLPAITDVWLMGFASLTTTCHWILSALLVIAAILGVCNILTQHAPPTTRQWSLGAKRKAAHDTLITIRARFNGDASMPERIDNALRIMAGDTRVLGVLAIQYRDPIMVLYRANYEPKRIQRDKAHNDYPKLGAEYANSIFSKETWPEYNQYADAIGPIVNDKLLIDAHAAPGTSKGVNSNVMQIWSAVVALMLFALPASAQNCETELMKYLGERRATTEKPSGQVRFLYTSGALVREASGKKVWLEVLRDNPFYTLADLGPLRAIRTPNGIVPTAASLNTMTSPIKVAPLPPTGDPVRPRPIPVEQPQPLSEGQPTPLFPDQPQGGQSWSLPDSLAMAEKMAGLRNDADRIGVAISSNADTIWQTMMYIFWKVFFVLWITGGICWYVAAFASKESAVNVDGVPVIGGFIVYVQQVAAGLCFLHVLVIGVVWLISTWLSISLMNTHIIWKCVLMGFNIYLTYLASQKVVPDIRVMVNTAMRR